MAGCPITGGKQLRVQPRRDDQMKKWMALPAAAVLAVSTAGLANAVEPWNQGFESDTAGWYDGSSGWHGSIDRVASTTNGIESADGDYHALVNGNDSSAPFTRFAGYSDEWDGGYTAEVDVYLDPSWATGTGFDYSVAANGSDGNHQRDYIFHVTKDTSTGALLVSGSNNTNFAPREDLENINHYEVTEAGWYTLQHSFYDNGGALAVDLNLLDADGDVLFTETRTNAADTIGGAVGGNRYGWFTFVTVEDLAIDNHKLYMTPTNPVSKDECTDGAWEGFGFKNQGQCIASIQANEKAGK